MTTSTSTPPPRVKVRELTEVMARVRVGARVRLAGRRSLEPLTKTSGRAARGEGSTVTLTPAWVKATPAAHDPYEHRTSSTCTSSASPGLELLNTV